MKLERKYWPVFLVNLFVVVVATIYYVSIQNYEFMIYVAVIIFFMAVVLFTKNKVEYPLPLLWGLSLWAFLHMAGGSLYINDIRLYDTIFINLVGEPYYIFKYDQAVHIFGFFVSTFVAYYLLKPLLIKTVRGAVPLAIVLTMAGLGAGSLNEIIEFITVLVASSTGVGGYENTLLDLVSNLIGATAASIYIVLNRDKL